MLEALIAKGTFLVRVGAQALQVIGRDAKTGVRFDFLIEKSTLTPVLPLLTVSPAFSLAAALVARGLKRLQPYPVTPAGGRCRAPAARRSGGGIPD